VKNASLFDSLLARPRYSRLTNLIVALLFVAPVAGAWVDGTLANLFVEGRWRGLFIPPVVISYIVWVSRRMAQVEGEVLRAFRPAVQVEDAAFDDLVSAGRRADPRVETLVLAIGACAGLATASLSSGATWSWSVVEWYVSMALMYGLIGWVIYGSVKSSLTVQALLKQPLSIDPLDIRPFEPIGRQSLLLSLVFVGGLSLSMVFSGLQLANLTNPLVWLVYVPAILIPVVLFFLSMYPTARTIARARDAELATVQAHLFRLCRRLSSSLDAGTETRPLSEEILAMSVYERHLLEARTWPYETTTLRRLFVSVLVPGVTLAGKILIDVLFD
jgi:hypothetical protein